MMHNKIKRRTLLKGILPALVAPAGMGIYPSSALAGQLEEPLTDSMHSVLSQAINAPAPKVVFDNVKERLAHLNWLGEMSDRLASRIPNWDKRIDFLETIWYESQRAGLEISLVLGLVHTESAFRQYAVSVAGAIGYMQVMPFWTRVIGDGDVSKLFHTRTNLRYGCVILRHYIDLERGDLFMALGRYNGSRGKSHYPDTVFNFRSRWAYAAPVADTPINTPANVPVITPPAPITVPTPTAVPTPTTPAPAPTPAPKP